MVTLTETAASRLRDLLAAGHAPGAGLRVAVVKGGCAGFSYKLAFAEGPGEGDAVVETRGVRVYVDAQSRALLEGSEVDYVDTVEAHRLCREQPERVSACGLRHLIPGRPARRVNGWHRSRLAMRPARGSPHCEPRTAESHFEPRRA